MSFSKYILVVSSVIRLVCTENKEWEKKREESSAQVVIGQEVSE